MFTNLHFICTSSACSCLTMHHRLHSTAAPMVHGSIKFKQQLFAMSSVGTSFHPCDHHPNGVFPPHKRCVKNSSCSASGPFLQTCSKTQLASRLARTVNCAEPTPHLPKRTCKSKLKASKHFPQIIVL